LQYMGKISYGMYVYHQVFVMAVLSLIVKLPDFTGKTMLGFLLIIILTSLVAHLSYKYWEQRFIKARPAQANLEHGKRDMPKETVDNRPAIF